LTITAFPPMPRWWTPDALAEVFNRALLGLALMTGLWYWLAGVWHQQLDNDQPWTTTGRLVRTAQRVGYMTGALALLVSFHLSLWPQLSYAHTVDAEGWRWGWGLAANGLLFLSLTGAALQTRRSTLAWLAVLTTFSVVAFMLVRSPHSWLGKGWATCWPTLIAVVGLTMVLLASLVSRSKRCRPFFEPTYLVGVFLAPLIAMAAVLLTDPMRLPQWVPSATFGCLTLLYVFAATVPGPRTFAAVAAICAVMGFWQLQEITGSATIQPSYYYAMLISLCVASWAWVVQQRKPTRVVRFVIWLGGSLALIALIAGLIASRT